MSLPVEYHDSWVFDYLRRRSEGLGHRFKNIAEGHDMFHPWPETVLGQYMTHMKGNLKHTQLSSGSMVTCAAGASMKTEPATEAQPINIIDSLKNCKDRYEQIIKLIEIYKPASIVEVGAWTGERAMLMAAEALRHKPEVFYIGFDLFHDITQEIKDSELNVKSTVGLGDVECRLKNFQTLNPGFKYQLVKGNTRETLPAYQFGGKIDFAFIDGGHSVDTIRSDYSALKSVAKLILMDDYYVKGVDTEKWGCNSVIKDEEYAILPLQDNFSNGQSIQMALLGEAMTKAPLAGDKKPINIQTKNSATNEEIRSHIRYAATLTRERLEEALKKARSITPVTFLDVPCAPHADTAVLIGASEELMDKDDPDYHDTWEEISKLNDDPANRLVICKTSYRKCFEESIIPWGCILLDPRDHVADKIDPHPDVIYFVSSMCHPSTWDKLVTAGVRVVGYHATVAAGEQDVIKQEFGKGLCISGGTTSILRGISLFYHLGFRKAVIYGATSSYKVGTDGKSRLSKPHGRSPKPFVNVEVHGRKFVTDPEMIAQSQDSEMAVKLFPDMALDFKGDGMLNHAVCVIRGFELDKVGEQSFTDIRIGPWVNAFRSEDLALEAISIGNANTAIQNRQTFLRETMKGLPDYTALSDWGNFVKVG